MSQTPHMCSPEEALRGLCPKCLWSIVNLCVNHMYSTITYTHIESFLIIFNIFILNCNSVSPYYCCCFLKCSLEHKRFL